MLHLRELLPQWTISNLIYGIRYLFELIQTSFTGFVTSLNYFRPLLQDSLPRWTTSDLIYGIRYLVVLFQTSLTGFIISMNYFRPYLRDSLLKSYSSTQNHLIFHLYVFLRHYANLFYLRTFVYTIHYLKVSLNTSLRNFGTKLNDYWPRCDIFTWIIVCDL